jgi:hypothetical protein
MVLVVISVLLSLAVLVMFIITFVVVIRIWNFHQEVLQSGGYPTVTYSRAKQEANHMLSENGVIFPEKIDEIINILSRYPDDLEASNLVQRLNTQKRAGPTGS